MYGFNEAWAITNSGFTEQARDGAKRLGIKFWDREILIEQMAKVNAAQTVNVITQDDVAEVAIAPATAFTKHEDDLFKCARCGKPVTHKVKEYCLSDRKRFNGRIYCFDHQR